MPSFRELFESIKEDLLAYTTIKVVKTKDWRLSSMQRFFNVGVGIYILFAIVFYHGYLNKESPVITVSTVMDGAAMAQYLANASLLYSNGGYPYAYCSSWVTNATNVSAATTRTVTDYVYSATKYYVNNECARYYSVPELTENVFMGNWLYTYWQQSSFARTCAPNNLTGTPAAGPGSIPTSPAMVGSVSNLPNCGTAQLLLNQSVFPVGAEYITLTISGIYLTSWGRTRTRMSTSISGPLNAAGTAPLAPALNFTATQPVSFTYAQLLEVAGIDLDSPNVLSDGGWGPLTTPSTVPNYPNYTAIWPSYRMTGVELVMEMMYYNHRDTLFPIDPFNLGDYLVAKVSVASAGTFRSPGPKFWYFNADPTQPEAFFTSKTPNGVLISFKPSGSIGIATFGAIFSALVNAMVLFAFAGAIVDVLAAFIIEGFKEQKFEDELELRIRLMLRTQLAPTPVRVEIDEYQQLTLVRQLKEEAAEQRARSRADRMRAANKAVLDPTAPSSAAWAAGGGAAAAAGGGEAADAVGGDQLRLLGGRTAPLTSGVSLLSPRVARLVLAGDCFHSGELVAQGFVENCRCVRFQWFTSRDSKTWTPVPGATQPSFYASPDELGALVACDATPVTDDGVEGLPCRAVTVNALSSRSHVIAEVLKRAAAARKDKSTPLKDGVWVNGRGAVVNLRASLITAENATTKQSLGVVDIPGCTCELNRDRTNTMTMWGADGMSLEISFATAEERDVFALTVRELAGSNLEMLNDPAFHPSPPVMPHPDEEEPNPMATDNADA